MNKISLLSREQENKKIFFQLGGNFGLPKELIIYIYQILMNSNKHDISMATNYHRNILSAHLCCPNYIPTDITLTDSKNPFQYRLPIGKGNEWLIKSEENRVENIMYYGYYNQLKSRDILHQQIKLYGETEFILKTTTIDEREYYEPLMGMERIKFIDKIGIDLFDHYFDYLERGEEEFGWNIIKRGDSYETIWLDNQDDQDE